MKCECVCCASNSERSRWLKRVMVGLCPAVPSNRVACGYLFIVNCSHIHTHTYAHTHLRTHAKMYTSTQCQTIQLATI